MLCYGSQQALAIFSLFQLYPTVTIGKGVLDRHLLFVVSYIKLRNKPFFVKAHGK